MLIQQEITFDIVAQLMRICLKEADVGGGERSDGFHQMTCCFPPVTCCCVPSPTCVSEL